MHYTSYNITQLIVHNHYFETPCDHEFHNFTFGLTLCAECIHDCISNVSLHVMLSIAYTITIYIMYVNIALSNITFYHYPKVELDNIIYTSTVTGIYIIQCKLLSMVT